MYYFLYKAKKYIRFIILILNIRGVPKFIYVYTAFMPNVKKFHILIQKTIHKNIGLTQLDKKQ